MNINDMSLRELETALEKKELSSVELTKYYIDKINLLDKDVCSYLYFDQELALKKAFTQDELRSSGKSAKSSGIPIALKDNIATKDMPTTCASKILEGYHSPFNATVYDKLEKSGFVTLGKVNMDEFAMGGTGETSYYKTTKNPWDLKRAPGGSSSGSAACVAASLAPISLGSDTGGSVRQPASFCGITGYKPSYGMISRYGVMPYASSLDQVGILAKSVDDIAYIMPYITGFDEKDPTSINNSSGFSGKISSIGKGLKIGISDIFFPSGMDDRVKGIVLDACEVYKKLGFEIINLDFPSVKSSVAVYQAIANSEASSNLSRYDGVRFGYSSKSSTLGEMYTANRDVFGKEVKKRILHGTYVLYGDNYENYYQKAVKARGLICSDFMNAYNKCDVVLTPTTCCTAPLLGKGMTDMESYINDILVFSVNMYGGCGISLPCGFLDGLPIGLQLQANSFNDELLLNIANAYQNETSWHKHSPKISK